MTLLFWYLLIGCVMCVYVFILHKRTAEKELQKEMVGEMADEPFFPYFLVLYFLLLWPIPLFDFIRMEFRKKGGRK